MHIRVCPARGLRFWRRLPEGALGVVTCPLSRGFEVLRASANAAMETFSVMWMR
jgi:hypothetical protein